MENLLALQPVAKELAQSKLHKHANPADVLFVISVGQALGLNAATALMNIYNVNGMPSMKADLKFALAKQHHEYDGCEIDSNAERCIIKMSRKSKSGKIETIISTFTIQDAARAELLKKDNWRHYPARMLKARALSFAVNDLFPDIALGIMSQEEAEDIDMKPKREYQEVTVIDVETQPTEQESQIGEIADQEQALKPEPIDEVLEIKKAISGMLTKMMDNNIDGFGDEIRRRNSIVKHLRESESQKDEMITVNDCKDYSLLEAYHHHLAAIQRGETAKPTIKQRQDVLIEKLNSMPIMIEELQEWGEKTQSATRHAALDEVQEWIDKVEAK